MKKLSLILILFLFSCSIFSQEEIWNRYEMDSILSIEFPGDVYEFDTIAKKHKLESLYSHYGDNVFLLQKIKLDNSLNENYSKLPYDISSLKKNYREFSKGVIKSAGTNKVISQEDSTIKDYHSYRILLEKEDPKSIYDFNIIHLNGYMYSINLVQSNSDKLNDSIRNKFLNSIVINNNYINQFGGKSQEYRIGYMLGSFLPYVLILGVILYFIFRKKREI